MYKMHQGKIATGGALTGIIIGNTSLQRFCHHIFAAQKFSAVAVLTLLILSFPNLTKAQSITISEINYSSNPTRDAGDWLEFHNFGTTDIDLSNWTFIDGNPKDTAFIFPSGTILSGGEYLVVYQNYNKFKTEYPGVSHKTGAFSFGLSKNGDSLHLRDNTGKAIIERRYSYGKHWPQGANSKGGRTLELRNPASNANLSNYTSWFDGCIDGSPGAAYSPCNERIDFSEINYNSDSLYNQSEFVELHNTTASDINISGYALRDGKDTVTHLYYIPSGTILPANGYMVLSNDTAAFTSHNKTVKNYVGPFGFNLSNTGDYIRLYDVSGKIIFSVYYQDSLNLTWPKSADGLGYTLELRSDTGKMDDGANWFSGCYGGSPGGAYSLNCGITGIEEFSKNNSLRFYPNPASEILYVENPSLFSDNIKIYDMTGRCVAQCTSSDSKVEISISSLNRGIYSIIAVSREGNYIGKLIKF